MSGMSGAELTARGTPFGVTVTAPVAKPCPEPKAIVIEAHHTGPGLQVHGPLRVAAEPAIPTGLLGTSDAPAPDLAALMVIDAALAPLDEAARDRVMEWLNSKWRRA